MRKFKLNNAIKYTDNEVKVRELLKLGYKEVDGGEAPAFKGHGEDPREPGAETVKVEKGVHTIEEPTTDEAEVAEAAPEEDAKKAPAKKAAAKK